MGSTAPPPAPAPDRKGVRKMLVLFAVLGAAGVLLLAISVVLGLLVLVAAEVLFFIAYRRFAKSPKPAG